MRYRKEKPGFTLVELLVVISIIALLLSILMPALNVAREKGRTIVCGSNSRSLGLILDMWILEHRGYTVSSTLPANPDNLNGSGFYAGGWSWSDTWVRSGYLKIPRTGESLPVSSDKYKDARRSILRCPSYRGTKVNYETKVNYGINYLSLGYDTSVKGRWYVYMKKRDNISRQSEVIAFGDSQISDAYNGYVIQPGPKATAFMWSPVTRHDKSANFIMLDGHVERLREVKIYDYANDLYLWKADKTKSVYEQWR